jgi:CheY-like chemotaxis protein
MIISIAVAIAVPLLFLYILWTLEVFEMSRRGWLLGSFVWGMGMVVVAVLIQNFLLRGIVVYITLALAIAPLLEEALKSLFLVFLSARRLMRLELDGVMYGFAVGTGFSVAENLYYIVQNPTNSLETTLVRVLSSSLMHATVTALVGLAIGLVTRDSSQRRLRYYGLGLGVAVLAHLLFNVMVLSDSGLALTLTAIGIGLAGAWLIINLIQRALAHQRAFIHQQLQGDVSDGELRAIQQPEQLLAVLQSHEKTLGAERIQSVRDYVTLQAQRAILLQSLSTSQRTDFMPVLRKQIAAIEGRIEQSQQRMGIYTATWLRGVLPSQESDLWRNLQVEMDDETYLLSLIQKLNTRQARLSKSEILKRKALLSVVELFKGLRPDELTDIAVLLQPMGLAKGADVIRQGDLNQSLYFVAQGKLLVNTTSAKNAFTILRTYKVGDSFGEMGILDDDKNVSPSQVSVIVAEDAVLYSLAREDFLTLVYARPQIALEVMRQLTLNIRHQTAIITEIRDNNLSHVETFADKENHVPAILVVDDTEANLNMLSAILRREKYGVILARDVYEARDHIKYTLPDLILLDIMLPDISGFDWALELKSQEHTRDLPIIFVSALTDLRNVMRGFDLGGVDYITKPYQTQEILARVRTHLHLVRMRQQIINQRDQIKVLLENSQQHQPTRVS